MEIVYEESDPQIAIKARLYVPGWGLSKTLREKSLAGKKVTIAYCDGIPVGVCTVSDSYLFRDRVETFVRKKYRRMGIGTELIKRQKNYRYADLGNKKISAEFFKKLGIKVGRY